MDEITAFVAEFHKDARGRLDLWCLTTFERDSRHLVTRRNCYDVDWSKKFGYYIFDLSGSGGSETVEVAGIYFAKGHVLIKETPTTLVHSADSPPWKSPETLAIRARNRTRRLKVLPRRFRYKRGGNLLNWLCDNGIQQPSVRCWVCQDVFPEERTCEHIWWCEVNGWWSTPDDRCTCATRAVCFGYFRDNEEEFALSPKHPPLRQSFSWR
jgi:hypothetical protein